MINKNVYLFLFIFISTIIVIFIHKKDLITFLSNKNKKNLIIGYVFNYHWEKVRNYFISLAKVGIKNCDIVIFVKGMSEETLEKIKSLGVIIYPIPDYPKLKPNSHRWEVYLNFLLENKDKYNLVFTTDIRDTIFQKDIFQLYENNKPFLGVFLEDILLNEKVNKDWVLDLCNETEFNNYFDKKPVICGGTLIGTIDKFIEFCQEFMKIVLETKANDQGILNYIIYYKKDFNDCLIATDNSGNVMTIGFSDRMKLNFDNDDNILNFNGQIPAAVHQYTRHKDIAAKISKKFNVTDLYFSNYKEEHQNIRIFPKETNKKIFIIIFVVIIFINIIFISSKFIKKIQKRKENFRKVKIKQSKKKKSLKKYRYIKI